MARKTGAAGAAARDTRGMWLEREGKTFAGAGRIALLEALTALAR